MMSNGTAKRRYSLTAEFLHFCLPDSFPIYDLRAAVSIQTWAYFEFPLAHLDQAEPFSVTKTGDPSGKNYPRIVDFYRRCLRSATENQLRTLVANAEAIRQTHVGRKCVGVLDLIDKLLWIANGDPRKLGLLP